MGEDLLWGIGACDYRGWDIPWSAVHSWGPRKASDTTPLQARRPGNQGSEWNKAQFGSLRPENQECPCPRAETGCPDTKESIFTLPPPFHPVPALSGLEDSHLRRWWGPSALLRLLTQVLISPRSVVMDTPRKNILSSIWAVVSPAKWTHKINHHSHQLARCSYCREPDLSELRVYSSVQWRKPHHVET